ncbi:LysM peptidoglycan-binding domain-containing protein [Oceanispirochaeta crateris]|uniref:LysM peptidoglycan-binding domain-containing protein n=1 Tax=Oceanispirochaeta crateris TaxID=2518645 RepID=A0A5C1QMF1_9SPIO|nr:LysM peptidoglycan-binding domain-containing protein [Oceanispirochaeta crateris]QEN07746.1 LysM peptidoglycan-binding domain-containing protein [Oceanispirochaeta crateris]
MKSISGDVFLIKNVQFIPHIAELEGMQNFRTRIISIIIFLILSISIYAQPLSHTLQQGETLYSLSRKYGVTVDEIMNANSINSPENLSVGSQLIIPGSNSGNSNENSETSQYIVQKGDTFYRIARNHGLSVNELFELNDFNGNRILKPGESVIVSNSAKTTVTTPAAESKVPQVSTSFSDNLVWPVEGVKQSLTGKLRGVKIEAPEASLVKSIASGSVVWTGPYRGFGQVILIDVNGYIYLYGGNEDVFVNVGEYVQAGSRIGRLGHSGLATRTVSMYFSVFKDGIPVSVVSAPRG